MITATTIDERYSAGAARIEEIVPSGFRLCRKKTGELVLQGCFKWSQGTSGGFEWRDLPTVEESDSEPT